MKRFQRVFISGLFLTLTFTAGERAAAGVILPGPADINRIVPTQSGIPPPAASGQPIKIPAAPASLATPIPANAHDIHFVLRGFLFEHVTVFTPQQLKPLYMRYVGKDVTLDLAWKIADDLTEMYRQQGYFLSRAYVPAQEASDSVLKIDAVEGAVGDVTLGGAAAPGSTVISKAIADIKAEKPLRLQTLERELLLLNDLPGLSFQSTLAPTQNNDDATARLILVATKTKPVTTVSVNNNGSRYIGPTEITADWNGSLLSMQQTDLSIISAPALSSTDGQFYSVNATHKVTLAPATSLDVTGGYSTANPGFVLQPENITSATDNGGLGLTYRLIRQRAENLSARVSVDFRDSATDIANTVLSRDYIRAAQLGVNYDAADPWLGHNYIDVELRHGLPVLGSSKASDTDLSKPDVHPDFTKLQLNYTRLQGLAKNWDSSLTLTGQRASGALYSSEEFGYGGSAIGRAYDTSEISGDDGVSGSAELHYQGLPQWRQISFTPYGFYDIGKVWDLYPAAPEEISGASAGPGLNIQCACGLSGNFYAAYPLTKGVDLPLYNLNHKSPRYSFQLTDKF